LAPEQKVKNNANTINQAADIFALGLIINECFTKENPAGSRFRLIADVYPLLSGLDTLVENMIRQNPGDRFSIGTSHAQLMFLRKQLKQNLQKVHLILREEGYPKTISRSVANTILKRASEDILVGKYLFSNRSAKQLEKYNGNWHMKIGYSVDKLLFNIYIQERILSLCRGKFEYETARYGVNSWYNSLDLKNNAEHKSLYNQLSETLATYDLRNNRESLLDLSGRILKYFSSCTDYHCKEILARIIDIERDAGRNLLDAPIISIVSHLKSGILENISYLINGFNGQGGKFEFKFEEHISIKWGRTQSNLANDDDEELFDSYYLGEEREIQTILSEFQKKWNVEINELDNDHYAVKFVTNKHFQKF